MEATEQAWLEAMRVTGDSTHGPASVQSPFHWLRSNNPAIKFLTQFSLLTGMLWQTKKNIFTDLVSFLLLVRKKNVL